MAELTRHRPSAKRPRRSVVQTMAALVVCALAALGVYLAVFRANGPAADSEAVEPARLEPVGTNGLTRVVLSAHAARRLDVRTVPVSSVRVNGKMRTAIPYDAVLYETNGDTWTYTSPEPRVFIRDEIRVARVERGLAILGEGPPLGTAVVTLGSAELWGVEYGEIEED